MKETPDPEYEVAGGDEFFKSSGPYKIPRGAESFVPSLAPRRETPKPPPWEMLSMEDALQRGGDAPRPQQPYRERYGWRKTPSVKKDQGR